MSKHTPGPWTFYASLPSTEPNWHIVTNSSRMRVLANVHIEPGNATDHANARLIAAAPELLAALQELLSEMGEFHNPNTEGWNMARAAIAKAEGE